MTSKVAVVGAVNGNISAVFGKLATLHAKNNFSFAIIAGNLFPEDGTVSEANEQVDRLLDGKIEVPLPTYFAIGSKPLPDSVVARLRKDGQVCSNLFGLGRRTTLKTSEGVRLVALGGAFAAAASKGDDVPASDEYSPCYTETDAKVLRGAKAADILITSDWSSGIRAGSAIEKDSESAADKEQQCIADLSLHLKPRYHFSTSPAFHEREPFFYPQDADNPGYATTRFISLAAYGNKDKQKWIYAFNLETKPGPLPTTPPPGATACPLTTFNKSKRKLPDQGEAFSRFGSSNGHHSSHHRHKKSRNTAPPLPSECFFCLSNPTAATHIIGSIGDASYLTTAKGPLTTRDTFPSLGDLPGHMLIIPLEHSGALNTITDPASRRQTSAEMHRYRRALHAMVSDMSDSHGGDEKLGSVTWAISRAANVHLHWQFLPLHAETIAKGLAEAAFKVQAENESYPRFEVAKKRVATAKDDGEGEEDGGAGAGEGGEYFRVWISPAAGAKVGEQQQGQDNDRGKGDTVMTLSLDSSFRFDLQFGRRVVAKLLGLEARSDWRNCTQGVEEETEVAEAFKRAFKNYDFALE